MDSEKIDDAALDAEYVLVVPGNMWDVAKYGIILVPCGSDMPVCFGDVMAAEAPAELPPDVKEIISEYIGAFPSWTVPYLCACGCQAVKNGGPWDDQYHCAKCRAAAYRPVAKREYSEHELMIRSQPIFFEVSIVFNPRRREPPYWWHKFAMGLHHSVTEEFAEKYKATRGAEAAWTAEMRKKAQCRFIDLFSGLLFS